MKHFSLWRNLIWLFLLPLLADCAQPLSTREKGALAGAGLGAATGALIGAATGKPGAGAAIGGALGGVASGLVGDQFQAQEEVSKEQQQAIAQQQQELARNRELLEDLKRQRLDARETERGAVVNLPDVLFDFGRANLTKDAVPTVRQIAEVLETKASGRHIAIEGHADSIGSEAFNQQLSERRAETVASALAGAGVGPQRLTATGFGERYPVAPKTNPNGTDNPAGRAKNRRVEVVIESEQ